MKNLFLFAVLIPLIATASYITKPSTGGGGGEGVWGSITGSIGDQLDLASALSNKEDAFINGDLTSGTTGLSVTGGTGAIVGSGVSLTIQTANGSQPGLLSAADWTTFNGKQAAGSYITALTGEVTASGPGSASATIANSAVTNAKLANMADATIKGNNSGGAAAPSDLSVTTVTSMLNSFVGDSGSGGTKGLVPAPASGDATKYLKGDGSWSTVTAGISTLNTLTDATQTFATGTSGTDFAISSSSGTHTFNLPTASGSNRGALSSSDWTTFNSKIGGSGTDNQLMRWDGTGSAQGSTISVTDNGAITNTLSGGTSAGLALSNGTASAPILQLKDNTTTIWDFQDGGFIYGDHSGSTGSTAPLTLEVSRPTASVTAATGMKFNLAVLPAVNTQRLSTLNFTNNIGGSAHGSSSWFDIISMSPSGNLPSASATSMIRGIAMDLNFSNHPASTSPISATGIIGVYAMARNNNSTAGKGGVGGFFTAYSGHTQLGLQGAAQAAQGTNAINIGIRGTASSASDFSATYAGQIGGLFAIGTSDATSLHELAPSVISALVADNQGTTGNIFLGRDNGTTVFGISDGGYITQTTTANVASNIFHQNLSLGGNATSGSNYGVNISLVGSASDNLNASAPYGTVALAASADGNSVDTSAKGAMGVFGWARGSNYVIGINGVAYSARGANARTIGVAGHGSTNVLGGSPSLDTSIGGYFEIGSGGGISAPPASTKSALVANNTSTTSDIFQAQDNGSVVFKVEDGGKVTGISQAWSVTTKTANYTLTATDYAVIATSNSFDLTLPTAVGVTGQIYFLKNVGTGTITVKTTSSQTIDNNASGELTLVQWDSLTVVSDGANWVIL